MRRDPFRDPGLAGEAICRGEPLGLTAWGAGGEAYVVGVNPSQAVIESMVLSWLRCCRPSVVAGDGGYRVGVAGKVVRSWTVEEFFDDPALTTVDDVPIALDGRVLDTPAKVVAYLEEIQRDAVRGRAWPLTAVSTLAGFSKRSNGTGSTMCSSEGSALVRTERPGRRATSTVFLTVHARTLTVWQRPARLGARLRVGGMSDEESRRLPFLLDAQTLASFGNSTWITDANPFSMCCGSCGDRDGRRCAVRPAARPAGWIRKSVESVFTSLGSMTSSQRKSMPVVRRKSSSPPRVAPPPR